MPLEVDAYPLVNLNLDRQAIYNVGKLAQKTCAEKTYIKSLSEIAFRYLEILKYYVEKGGNIDKESNGLAEIDLKTAMCTTTVNSEPFGSYGQIFGSGMMAAQDISKLEKLI